MSEKKNIRQENTAAGMQRTEKENKAVIYLGPALAGVAMPGTVYRNGLTPQLQKAVEEIPALGRLLPETSKASLVRKDLKDPQSAAGICYEKVLEYAKKKGAEG